MYNLPIFDVSQHYILTINTKYDIITLTSIAKHNNVVLWQRRINGALCAARRL